MKVVQKMLFVNESEEVINEWLSKVPADDIVSVSYQVVGFENGVDEYTTIFYKTVLPQ
ncbi:hypothetical protein [Brevibacillus sp. SIMBA_040]|uniref:hypothetical protein n=1 Tax=unclassified Brevibacillus TaxID=2684853 RepID=UPI00397AE124